MNSRDFFYLVWVEILGINDLGRIVPAPSGITGCKPAGTTAGPVLPVQFVPVLPLTHERYYRPMPSRRFFCIVLLSKLCIPGFIDYVYLS